MEHSKYKELIKLYLYNELDPEKEKLFEDHIQSCKECEMEMKEFKKLFSEIDSESHSEISPELLKEARSELRGYLRAQRNSQSVSNKIFSSIYTFISKPVGFAIMGATILLVGFVIGYLIFKTPVAESLESYMPQLEKLKIQNINFVNSNTSDGQVEFTFETVKEDKIIGSVNDPDIQKILTYAIVNAQNPGTRLNSINVINAKQIQNSDNEIKSALITVAKFDDNPGVRLEALRSLDQFTIDKELKDALIYVLMNDTSSGIRIQAINSLANASQKGISFNPKDLNLLREKTELDKNNYVRFQAKNIIKEY